MSQAKRVTTRTLQEMKEKGERIAALTAYDAIMGNLFDRAGIDVILVGDSVANVVQGHETTLPVTLDEIIYHTKAVTRGVERAMVVADLPFMSFQISADDAFRNAGRIMKETLAGAVKLEGGKENLESVRRMTAAGIPVMGHLGLQPQSIHLYGGYRPRGKEEEEADMIVADAMALQEAGAFCIVLEKIPADLASQVTSSLTIPTIGIGAGAGCDGQILVYADMLGLTIDFHPRFVRRYDSFAERALNAAGQYAADVKDGTFPNEDESY
ncbi:MAG: 3-methyl-2-oxobutanoate hydroxymethyltransferase [Ignavibacteriae bacterium]|nr:3-methyl-2-oxobutanoate hydroxymethyltransferase [Ignavibacteriota bacterium]MCB9215063.1 3-methyl-2-oxobutanoate hydroxymethyltransferase [Ignavibacteria bacterium]